MTNFTRDFRIITQDFMTVEINHADIFRNIRANGARIYFFNGWILGTFASPVRAFEVWEELQQAANDGKEVFAIPQE